MGIKRVKIAGTMQGYSLKTWFARNKDTLKAILITISGIATYFATQGNLAEWAVLILTGLVPAIIKLGTDALDFYATEVVLN